jgi:hypothetical protein
MNPGIIRAREIYTVSIAAMLAVSPTTVPLAACLIGIVLSIGTIVIRYPIANANQTASRIVEYMFHPSR